MLDPKLQALLSGQSQVTSWLALTSNPIVDGGGADTGGPNPLPHGKFTWQGGVVTFQSIKRNAGQPWDNFYGYQTLAKTAPASLFALAIDFAYVTPADFAQSTAFECEIELCEAGIAYNMGIQSKGSSVDGAPAWRMFNQGVTPKRWDAIPGSPVPSASASMVAYFSINRSTHSTTHEAIEINRVLYPIGVTHSAIKKWPNTVNYLHSAIQLDSDGKGSSQAVRLSKWEARGI